MSAVTALDTPPSSTDISNFSVRGDAFRADMQTMTPQVNALNVEAAATVVALTSSNALIAAATAVATAIVSATKWVTGSYDADVSVWSPTDFQTYVSLADGVGATDPASDSAHWRCVTLRPASAALVDPSFVDGLSVGLTALDTASVDTLAASGTNDTMQDLLSNTLDCATANWFRKTIIGATTLAVSNVPSGFYTCVLIVTAAGANLTLWSGIEWAGGVEPLFSPTDTDVIGLTTTDGGTTWTAQMLCESLAAGLDLNFLSGQLDPRITFTRASNGSYFDAAGVMQYASSDAPRLAHYPVTRAPRGLFIEEQRTNLVPESSTFNDPSWTKNDVTVVADGAVAPDGTMTMDYIVPTAISTQHRILWRGSMTAGATYTFSAFVKAHALTTVRLLAYEDAPTGAVRASAGWDLSTGSEVEHTGPGWVNSTIAPVGGGIFRVTLTYTALASTTIAHMIYPGSSSNSNSQTTGDGVSGLYVWGAQLEVGASPTSYIPTAGAAATRATDKAVMTGADFSRWYNQSEGTFVIEAERGPDTGVVARYANVESTGGTTRAQIARNGTVYSIVYNDYSGAQQAVFSSLLPAADNAVIRLATAYATNSFAATRDGAAPSTDVAGTPADDCLLLCIGDISSPGAARTTDSCIRRLRYYPRRLPDSVLQALTA